MRTAHSVAATTEGNSSSTGGLLISGAAYDHVRGRIEADFVDLGSPSPVVLTIRPRGWRRSGAPPRDARGPLAPSRLVLAHEARVADDVDRSEAAGGGHCSGTPALRRPSRMGSSWAR